LQKQHFVQILTNWIRYHRHSAHNFAPVVSSMVLEHLFFLQFPHILGVGWGQSSGSRRTWQGLARFPSRSGGVGASPHGETWFACRLYKALIMPGGRPGPRPGPG